MPLAPPPPKPVAVLPSPRLDGERRVRGEAISRKPWPSPIRAAYSLPAIRLKHFLDR